MSAREGWRSAGRDTVLDALDRSVERRPDETFLEMLGAPTSYGDYRDLCDRVAGGLRALGVTGGERVVTLLDNSFEAVAAWHAVNRAGGIFVPLNTALKGSFLQRQIVNAEPVVAIAHGRYLERLAAVAEHAPPMGAIVCAGEPPIGTDVRRAPSPASTPTELHCVPWRELTASEPIVDAPAVAPEDLSAIVYTGGTTGPAKGCMLSHNYVCNMSSHTLELTQRRREEAIWSALPLFHLNAMSTVVATSLIQGRAAFSDRFSVSRFWPEVERSGARIVSVLGSMATLLANASDDEAMARVRGRVRVAIGAPVSEATREIWRERFGVRQFASGAFGQTEACCITLQPCSEPSPPGSAGRLHGDFDVRIFDADDNELPVGDAGEIVFRPLKPHVMFEGYWRDPEATARFPRNLWWHSGDMGRMDENGFLYFLDRKKDYIRRRGENVASGEVEAVYNEHPEIVEASVHAVPSSVEEDDVKVTVVLRPGAEMDPHALFQWATERIPYFALPRYIEFRDDLPRTEVGRVRKQALREDGVTPATWDREAAGVVFERW